MNRFSLLLSLVLISTIHLSAQTVNDFPIADIDTPYLELRGTAKMFSTKVSVAVEFGQDTKFFGPGKRVIKDADGKAVEFNSMIAALNFFDKLGYEFVQAYVVTSGGQNVYYYLMKRKTE